ncbi:MAG: hypothetical protein M9935_02535 [Kiritimatiellae bacterium]|nr:hypothetical protein [Kiritimatiellia bacterium]
MRFWPSPGIGLSGSMNWLVRSMSSRATAPYFAVSCEKEWPMGVWFV